MSTRYTHHTERKMTLERDSVKISDNTPFLEEPPILPTPPFLEKFQKIDPSPSIFYKGRGVPTMGNENRIYHSLPF